LYRTLTQCTPDFHLYLVNKEFIELLQFNNGPKIDRFNQTKTREKKTMAKKVGTGKLKKNLLQFKILQKVPVEKKPDTL
jgi:hypothetical protein